VAAISGGGVSIEIVGKVSSYKGALRATFTKLPDAPVKRFTMHLLGGDKGLIETGANPCLHPQPGSARFIGQNNRGAVAHPAIIDECSRKHGKHRGGRR
jgi:hypothetical protein